MPFNTVCIFRIYLNFYFIIIPNPGITSYQMSAHVCPYWMFHVIVKLVSFCLSCVMTAHSCVIWIGLCMLQCFAFLVCWPWPNSWHPWVWLRPSEKYVCLRFLTAWVKIAVKDTPWAWSFHCRRIQSFYWGQILVQASVSRILGLACFILQKWPPMSAKTKIEVPIFQLSVKKQYVLYVIELFVQKWFISIEKFLKKFCRNPSWNFRQFKTKLASWNLFLATAWHFSHHEIRNNYIF